MSSFVESVEPLLGGYLARQRWFAGAAPEKAVVDEHEELAPRLHWLVVDADGARYQLLLGRIDGEAPEFLHGHDREVVGEVDGGVLFDGLLDNELALALLSTIAPREQVQRVRPMGAEQSNTSLVFDDRLVLKVFRRLHDGPNPDVEVTGALAAGGFAHVAAPVATWERDGAHLAIVQPFLGGGTDGWSLALTSLRDYYDSDCETPETCGGDFAGEAARLGEVTAHMHLALAATLGTHDADIDAWLSRMHGQLDRLGAGQPWEAGARALLDRLRSLDTVGPAIRVHGDYHLGQVLRSDVGWHVLDFEGEPARALHERREVSSPLKDVAGMLRSFHYATEVALRERRELDWAEHRHAAAKWEARNRNAFLEAYLATEGTAALLPGAMDETLLGLAVWELDKAVYEVGYERDHRPEWVDIPESAIQRLLLRTSPG